MTPDNQNRLTAQLQADEGWRESAYTDSLGFLTIGYGHLIDQRKGGKISPRAGAFILQDDIADATLDLAPFAWFNTQDEVRQCALINMRFNLGLSGLLHFPQFLAHMGEKDYEAAVAQLVSTPWHQQVGVRADRIIQLIKTGAWP